MHKEIREQCRRNCWITRLANSNKCTKRKKPAKAVHERAEQCRCTPQRDAERHNPFSWKSIAQIAENWRKNHVANNEDRLQQAALVVFDFERVLNVG